MTRFQYFIRQDIRATKFPWMHWRIDQFGPFSSSHLLSKLVSSDGRTAVKIMSTIFHEIVFENFSMILLFEKNCNFHNVYTLFSNVFKLFHSEAWTWWANSPLRMSIELQIICQVCVHIAPLSVTLIICKYEVLSSVSHITITFIEIDSVKRDREK